MSKGILGGVIAGLIGAGIWGGITYASNLEIGWIAWGIGFLVGLGVRVGTGGEESTALGAAAALIALGSVIAGKFFAVYLIVANLPPIDFRMTPQQMMVSYALDICDERAAKGKPVRFPSGIDIKTANKAEDFPRDVWAEATKRWEKLGADGQKAVIDKQNAAIQQFGDAFRGELRAKGFADSFSPWDLLWGFLAITTPYKLAAGISSSE